MESVFLKCITNLTYEVHMYRKKQTQEKTSGYIHITYICIQAKKGTNKHLLSCSLGAK